MWIYDIGVSDIPTWQQPANEVPNHNPTDNNYPNKLYNDRQQREINDD
jgi:hypothetical protein